MQKLDSFTEAYLVAALWSSTDFDGNPLDDDYGIEDIAEESLAEMIRDCKNFQEMEAENLEKACELHGNGDDYNGHDFWLTRNGHGCGFWDRGTGEVGDALAQAAKIYGSCDLYVGDDGKIYC